MRLPIWLSGLCALCIACGAPEQSDDELGVLTQAITETFSGTLAQNEAVRPRAFRSPARLTASRGSVGYRRRRPLCPVRFAAHAVQLRLPPL